MNGKSWVQAAFRSLATAGMVGCIALSLVNLIHLFYPDWNGAYLVAGSVLAAIEAAYSRRLIIARNIRGRELTRFRFIEIVLLILLVLAGRAAFLTWDRLLAAIRTWAQGPVELLDLESAFALAIALESWWMANQTAHDFETIGDRPTKGAAYEDPVEALTGRFLRGGAILLVIAGITRVGIASVLQLRRPPVPGLVLNVLVYFALGLVMLGQIQFTRLSNRWRDEGTDVSGHLAGHWARYTLALLGLAGLVAFLLPTGYSVSLLEVASLAMGVILYAFNVVFHLLIMLFFLILTPLARLFGTEVARQPAAPAAPGPAVPPIGASGAPAGWFEIAKSVAFWTVTLVGIAYIVSSYLRDRPELASTLAAFKPFRGTRRLVVAVWGRLARLIGAVRQRVPTRLRALRGRLWSSEPPDPRPSRFFRLGALSRRERTLYYYLSILRRAARRGCPRDGSETPHEYETKLAPHVPEAEEELARLTEAFVETRYSTHGVEREQEKRVRADWRKVRAALRMPRDSGSPG